jgi:hypothetical protein
MPGKRRFPLMAEANSSALRQASSEAVSRLDFLDWTRGLGALIMLQGHAYHSFTHPAFREHTLWVYSQFLGGLPPAIFLFLTGVTLAFLMDSLDRKNLPPLQRIWGALKRARYLFLIAFAFRLQMWLLGLPKPLDDMLRVDILNCMGFGVAVFSLLAVFPTPSRARLSAALGIAIAAASPLISQIDWTSVSPHLARYFLPDAYFFGFFPWAAFLAFGLATGSALRLTPPELYDRLLHWLAVTGVLLILGARHFADLPFSFYSKVDFWIDSPALVFIKTGVVLLMLAFGFVWSTYIAAPGFSAIRLLGMNSLFVYWIHIELVYGRWLWFWKEGLTIPQATLCAIGVIAVMVALTWGWKWGWTRRNQWLPEVRSRLAIQAARVE